MEDIKYLISIIIPVYKVEKYLNRCVQSIVSQTYTKWELILIDDGSPDNSGTLCDAWALKDPRIKAFHKSNGGVSSARNLGIKKSHGTYITFVDSDDWVESSYLADFFDCGYSIENSIYIQGINYYIPRRNKSKVMFKYADVCFDISDNLDLLLSYEILNNGCPVAKLFKREVILDNNISFKEDISLNEDHLFVLTYYNYIHRIVLSRHQGYKYFFDFTEPSLTKLKHKSREYIRISRYMQEEFTKFRKRFKHDESYWSKYYGIMGLRQIMFAVINSHNEPDAKFIIRECINIWKDSPGTNYFLTNGIRENVLSYLLNNKQFVLLYYISLYFNKYDSALLTIKYRIKTILKF